MPTTEPTAIEASAETPTETPTAESAEPTPINSGETPAAETPTAAQAVAADGASIFSAACANCHGVGGAGTGRGPSIIGIGQFFTADASPLTALVTNGGTNMPAFGTRLTTAEINAVVEYVVATFQ